MKKTITLLLCFSAFGLLAQRTITGTVYALDGERLVGAYIWVKGTTIGTSTDIDGHFSIVAPKNMEILMFSFVGKQNEEITIGISNTINATLSNTTLPEFVVSAHGKGCCHGCGNTIIADYTTTSEISSLEIYTLQNPFLESLALIVKSEEDEKVVVSLHNIEGKTLKTLPTTLVKGENNIRIDGLNDLIAGVYVVSVAIQRDHETQKIEIENTQMMIGEENYLQMLRDYNLDKRDINRPKGYTTTIVIDKNQYAYFKTQHELRSKIKSEYQDDDYIIYYTSDGWITVKQKHVITKKKVYSQVIMKM